MKGKGELEGEVSTWRKEKEVKQRTEIFIVQVHCA